MISHSLFVHVAFGTIAVFQTFHRMIFGRLSFPGAMWYLVRVLESQMVRGRKKFGNHFSIPIRFPTWVNVALWMH